MTRVPSVKLPSPVGAYPGKGRVPVVWFPLLVAAVVVAELVVAPTAAVCTVAVFSTDGSGADLVVTPVWSATMVTVFAVFALDVACLLLELVLLVQNLVA